MRASPAQLVFSATFLLLTAAVSASRGHGSLPDLPKIDLARGADAIVPSLPSVSDYGPPPAAQAPRVDIVILHHCHNCHADTSASPHVHILVYGDASGPFLYYISAPPKHVDPLGLAASPTDAEWMDLIPGTARIKAIMAQAGINRSDARWGVILEAGDHRLKAAGSSGLTKRLHQAGANWNKAISERIVDLHQKGKLTPRSLEKAIKKLKGSERYRELFMNSVRSPLSHGAWKRVANKGKRFDDLLQAQKTANSMGFWQKRALLRKLGRWGAVGVKTVGWIGVVYAVNSVGTAYADGVPPSQIAQSLVRDETLVGLAYQAAEAGADRGWGAMEGWVATCPVAAMGSLQEGLMSSWEDEHSGPAPDCTRFDQQLEALQGMQGAQLFDSTVLGK